MKFEIDDKVVRHIKKNLVQSGANILDDIVDTCDSKFFRDALHGVVNSFEKAATESLNTKTILNGKKSELPASVTNIEQTNSEIENNEKSEEQGRQIQSQKTKTETEKANHQSGQKEISEPFVD